MKKIYLSLCFATISLFTYAQFNKGDKLLGGSFNISYSSSKNNDIIKQSGFNVGLSPSYAWFTSSTTALGFRLNGAYGHQSSNNGSPHVSSHDFGYGVSFFLQKYKTLDSRFSLYAECGVGSNWSNAKARMIYPDVVQESNANNWNMGLYITPGLNYKLTQRLLLDLSLNSLLNVNFAKYKSVYKNQQAETTSKSSGFSIGSTFNNNVLSGVGIGFKWLLK